ncbi:AbrB/MazE/SpoVT family DNA-binding domain-containing protein [Faecalimicrobium sp. JNUCC 81]
MKDKGIERKLDRLGRIIIPKEIRTKLNFKENQSLNISVVDNAVIITKSKKRCLFCYESKELKEYNDFLICKECIENISDIK